MSEERHHEERQEEKRASEQRHLDWKILEALDLLVQTSGATFSQIQQQTDLLTKIYNGLCPRLGSISIQFEVSPAPGETIMAAIQGPVTLTTVGQVATASILYFDTTGAPMAATFVPPAVTYSVNDTAGAIEKVVDNGDGTATVTDVANGVANLTASATSAEGLAVSDTETVTVFNGTTPPPTQTLGSIKIAFDGGTLPVAAAAKK